MRFHEFNSRRRYELVVTAPQTVSTPEPYHSVSDTEELLHIPIEAPEAASNRRKMYLLAYIAMAELEQKPPTDQEWEICQRAFEILKQIASKDYQLTQLKNKQKANVPFAEIE